MQPRTSCLIPFCFCVFVSNLLSIPCHECLWLKSAFTGDKLFGLVYVGQLVWRGKQHSVGSCFRFYHRYVKWYSDHEDVFSGSTPHPNPPISSSSYCSTSTLLSYILLQLSSISARINVSIDNLCYRQRFCVGQWRIWFRSSNPPRHPESLTKSNRIAN